jgi:hypothetical protein
VDKDCFRALTVWAGDPMICSLYDKLSGSPSKSRFFVVNIVKLKAACALNIYIVAKNSSHFAIVAPTAGNADKANSVMIKRRVYANPTLKVSPACKLNLHTLYRLLIL